MKISGKERLHTYFDSHILVCSIYYVKMKSQVFFKLRLPKTITTNLFIHCHCPFLQTIALFPLPW